MTIEGRFHQLKTRKYDIIPPNERYIISDRTVFLDGFIDCAGVVLLGAKFVGALHSVNGNTGELQDLHQLMVGKERPRRGIVIAGADTYALNLIDALMDLKVPLVATYFDHHLIQANQGWDDIESEEAKQKPNISYWMKSMIVNPTPNEVLLFSERCGYRRLV